MADTITARTGGFIGSETMRNHTGRMAVAFAGLAAALTLGAGIASASPTVTPDLAPGVQARISGTPGDFNTHDCTVMSFLGGGVGSGSWLTPGQASGLFLLPGPAVAFCNGQVILGSVG